MMHSIAAFYHRRKVLTIAIAIVLLLSLFQFFSYASGHNPIKWSKPSAGATATPLYNDANEIKILPDGKPKSDPCFEVALDGGNGRDPKPVQGTLVLVTGGGGFIGSNLADRLLKLGYRVRILDNLYTGFIRNVPLHQKNVEFIFGDILNPEILKAATKDVEFVFHLAAMSKVVPSVRDPEMAKFCTENNAIGTWNVLNSTREKGVKKVIYAGSSTFYGNRPIPHNEDMAPDFLTPYAASKYEGEIQMQMFDRLFKIPTVVNRFFMVYGPRQPTTGAYAIVTGVFARQASLKQPLTIEGDGSHFRDFIHVQDIVTGLILSQQTDNVRGGTPINLGSGEYFTVKNVADLISKEQTHLPERPNDLVGTLADTCRMKRLLGYKTKMNFTEQMSYMAKETMLGNVFAQEWVTPLHSLSVPHIVPVGDKNTPWATTGTWKDVINSFNLYEEQAVKAGQETWESLKNTFTLIPFFGSESEVADLSTVLVNTVFSLVRFGEIRRYAVIATGPFYDQCVSMNLPCIKATATETPAIISETLEKFQRVHIARIGTTYIKPLLKVFDAHVAEGIVYAPSDGDIFLQGSSTVRSNVRSWSDKAASSGKKDQAASNEFLTSQLAALVKAERALENGETCPAPSACPDSVFISLPCIHSDYKAAPAEKIGALKKAKLWQLADCTNGKYCDLQQSVPLRWLKNPPELSAVGNWC